MTLISDLSIYTNDSNLVPNITTISATEHNTHRTNVRDLLQDFIDVVGDLQNCYASASEPTDKPDGKDWFDSSNSVKKTRIGSAWYTLVTTTQTQTLTNKTLTSPTIGSGLTLSGDITATSAALDFDLVDNNASALSFDATGKTGILEIITTDSAEGVAFSGFIRAQNTGLKIYDSGSDHLYTIAIGTNATANRTLTFTPGDADRTITLSGNPTLSDWFDQSVKQAASPTFIGLTVSGEIAANGGVDVASGQVYQINNTSVLSSTTLGSGVVNSSLTSVGTLTSLTVSGDVTVATSTLKVDSTNNRVGIGTTTPSYTLHVAGETSVNKLRVNDGESSRYAAFIHAIGGTPYGRSGSNGGTGARQFKITGFTQQTDSSGSLETDVIDFDGAHLLLLKDQKGNVGIGTTTPQYSLHVAGSGGFKSMTIDQGADDGSIIRLISSDVSHPFTAAIAADVYMDVSKYSATEGGVDITGYSEAVVGLQLEGWGATADTTDNSSSRAALRLSGNLHNGSGGGGSLGGSDNILIVDTNGSTRFLIKGNGDCHLTNTTLTALDDYDDISLARNLQLALGGERYKHKLSKQEFNKLVQLKALSSTGEFQIAQGVNAVTLGAISQIWNTVKSMALELGFSEQKLLEMAKNYQEV